MKTTLEIPDRIFRRAKATAAEQKIPLRQFVSEAVAAKLEAKPRSQPDTWLKHSRKLRSLRKETARIGKLIEEEFEKIDPEEWE